MDPLRALSPSEEHVIRWMRQLTQQSREWRLTLTMHRRKDGSYLQVEPTPYLKVSVQPEAFLAVE